MTTLYHSTSERGARAIAACGFAESTLAGMVLGVFLASRPLTWADGVASSAQACFAVEVPDAFVLEPYEIVEDDRPEEAYREWIVPAATVNCWPRRRLPLDD